MTACTFPRCDRPPTATNRAGQPTCHGHQLVVVSASASYLDDRHAVEKGHG